jgi:hypothetical protein
MNRAYETFEEFHARSPVTVYPFSGDEYEFEIDCLLPDFVYVGKALRVLYESDKWNDVGDVQGYYHDHGPDDGAHSFSGSNKIKLYAPKPYFDYLPTVKFPVRWPKSVVLLGSCGGWYAKEPGYDKPVDAKTKGDILVCSPFGHVSRTDKKRVFLAVIEEDTGIVECIINGPNLRVTSDGITG